MHAARSIDELTTRWLTGDASEKGRQNLVDREKEWKKVDSDPHPFSWGVPTVDVHPPFSNELPSWNARTMFIQGADAAPGQPTRLHLEAKCENPEVNRYTSQFSRRLAETLSNKIAHRGFHFYIPRIVPRFAGNPAIPRRVAVAIRNSRFRRRSIATRRPFEW